MERRLALLMANEAQSQATYAFRAVEGVDANLKLISDSTLDSEERKRATEMFWFNMQMFLVSSANVSKILWGEFGTNPEERLKVRELVETEHDSALKSRRLRNHFEHYDQRLIDWHKTSVNKNIASNIIGPDNMIGGLNPKEIMKHYNPQEGKVTFRGETFHLIPVVKELKRIMKVELPHW